MLQRGMISCLDKSCKSLWGQHFLCAAVVTYLWRLILAMLWKVRSRSPPRLLFQRWPAGLRHFDCCLFRPRSYLNRYRGEWSYIMLRWSEMRVRTLPVKSLARLKVLQAVVRQSFLGVHNICLNFYLTDLSELILNLLLKVARWGILPNA